MEEIRQNSIQGYFTRLEKHKGYSEPNYILEELAVNLRRVTPTQHRPASFAL